MDDVSLAWTIGSAQMINCERGKTLTLKSTCQGISGSCPGQCIPANLSGFILFRVVSSKLKSYQLRQADIIQPILMSDPHPHYIRLLKGCLSEQLYSSYDAVGAPQLDLDDNYCIR